MIDIEIVSLHDDTGLSRSIANQFSKEVIFPELQKFADGEMRVVLKDPAACANKTVLLVQSTCQPVHETILAVAFLAHELANAGAKKVIGVLPYFGYCRQEKSDIPDKSGPAAVIAKLLESVGLDSIITVELHTATIKDFFSIPIHNVILYDLIAQHIQQHFTTLENICFIAPDKGAQERVQAIAQRCNAGVLVFHKERLSIDKTCVVGRSGQCVGETAIIIDDIIDTGGTALNVCNELVALGFKNIYGYFVHPVFSGDALKKIEASPFTKVFVSNTIALPRASAKVAVFDISRELLERIEKLL